MSEAEEPLGQPCTHFLRSHQLGRQAIVKQIHRHLFDDLGESRQRFRAESDARSMEWHAATFWN
jgi:hypothetical protein